MKPRWALATTLLVAACLSKPNPLHGLGGNSDGASGSSSSTASGGTTSDATSSSSAASSTTTDGYTDQWDVIASIATCTHDTIFDPTACLLESDGELCVDLSDGVGGEDLECRAHLRFDLYTVPTDSPVTMAELHLTVFSSEANETGTLWLVDCFDETELTGPWPTQTMMLGDDQGMVVRDQVVVWTLPTSLFAPVPAAVCFQVAPTTTDGVEYGALAAAERNRPLLRLYYGN